MDEAGSNRSSSMIQRGKKDKDAWRAVRARLPGLKADAPIDRPSAFQRVNRPDVLLERSALGHGKHVKFVEEDEAVRKPRDRFVFVLNEVNSVVSLTMRSVQAGGFVRALKALCTIQKGQVNLPMTRPSQAPQALQAPTRRRPMRSPWPSQEADDRTLTHLEAIRDAKRVALEAALKEGPASLRVKSLASEVELAEADIAAFIQLRSIDH